MMSKHVYSILQKATYVADHYYPEQLYRVYITNSPWVFSGVWSIIKGWIHERTRDKIVMTMLHP